MKKKRIIINKIFPYTNYKYKCKCGKKVLMKYDEDFRVCPRCGRRVKKDSRSYFRDKVRQLLNRSRNERFKENKRNYKFVYR